MLERTSVQIVGDAIEARFCVALPARGRTILGEWASAPPRDAALARPRVAVPRGVRREALKAHLDAVEDQRARAPCCAATTSSPLSPTGNPACASPGASDLPLDAATAVPFASPPELAVELALPNAGAVRGMGIRRGVTLVAGGGFHGKSTLLEALQLGVYDQLPGDGRERVVTDGDAVKVRAEDGRAVTSVDISTFIDNLPYGRKTNAFTSADASGSTSQAAAIVEAVQAGASALLIDEDTSATNFMIETRGCKFVAADREPIKLHRACAGCGPNAVSSIIVVGGAGDYFDVADTVLLMDSYAPSDATARAKAIAAELPRDRARLRAGRIALQRRDGAALPLRSGWRPAPRWRRGASACGWGGLSSTSRRSSRSSSTRRCARSPRFLRLAPPLDGTRDVAAVRRARHRGGAELDALKPDCRVGNLALRAPPSSPPRSTGPQPAGEDGRSVGE